MVLAQKLTHRWTEYYLGGGNSVTETTQMHPEGITLYEISQEDKYHMISLTCGIDPKKKKKTKIKTKQKL